MSALWAPKSGEKDPGVQDLAVGVHVGTAEAQPVAEDLGDTKS